MAGKDNVLSLTSSVACATLYPAGKMSVTPSQIRELRKQLGLSQPEFAKKIGVNRVTVARWETGRTIPSPLALEKLEALRREITK